MKHLICLLSLMACVNCFAGYTPSSSGSTSTGGEATQITITGTAYLPLDTKIGGTPFDEVVASSVAGAMSTQVAAQAATDSAQDSVIDDKITDGASSATIGGTTISAMGASITTLYNGNSGLMIDDNPDGGFYIYCKDAASIIDYATGNILMSVLTGQAIINPNHNDIDAKIAGPGAKWAVFYDFGDDMITMNSPLTVAENLTITGSIVAPAVDASVAGAIATQAAAQAITDATQDITIAGKITDGLSGTVDNLTVTGSLSAGETILMPIFASAKPSNDSAGWRVKACDGATSVCGLGVGSDTGGRVAWWVGTGTSAYWASHEIWYNNSGSYTKCCSIGTYGISISGLEVGFPSVGGYRRNTCLGEAPAFSHSTGDTGWYNSALSINALNDTTTGYYNTGAGYNALRDTTTGYGNTAVGYQAGETNLTGFHNTFLGQDADVTNNAFENATAIGYNAYATQSNMMRFGDTNVTLNSFSGDISGDGDDGVKGFEYFESTDASSTSAAASGTHRLYSKSDGVYVVDPLGAEVGPLGSNNTTIDTNTTVYVATTGSDSTGDGSSGNPYYSINGAMDGVEGWKLVDGAQIVIDVTAGHYTWDEQVIDSPLANRIKIYGELGETTLNMASPMTVTGSTGNWTIVLPITATDAVVGDYIGITNYVDGSTALGTEIIYGVHEVTGVAATEVTVTSNTAGTTCDGSNPSANDKTLTLKSVASFSDSAGIRVMGTTLAHLEKLCLVGDGAGGDDESGIIITNGGIGGDDGNSEYVIRMGLKDWYYGVNAMFGSFYEGHTSSHGTFIDNCRSSCFRASYNSAVVNRYGVATGYNYTALCVNQSTVDLDDTANPEGLTTYSAIYSTASSAE